ncbi:MAG: STAS/SEC14 domain-containing protein [Planctomycetes bacterium]|nr:STAS/SEC14 domain-containing protein [Planctomycetota bacterium]
MPIHINEDNNGKLLIVHLSGKLTKEDYTDLVPVFERRVQQQHGKLCLLLDMHDFHGWDVSAAWEDLKLGISHFNDVERLAMVGENRWQEAMAIFAKPFTMAKVRYFEHAELEAARQWLSEANITS